MRGVMFIKLAKSKITNENVMDIREFNCHNSHLLQFCFFKVNKNEFGVFVSKM